MTDLVFEKLTQALVASQEYRLNIAGDFFRISELSYPVTVALIKDFRIIGRMENMQAGDYVRDIAFDGVLIINGALSQNISVQISGGGAGSDRVLGEVSVINGEVKRVKDNNCFIGTFNSPAVAAEYSHAQLKNISADKNLIVTQVIAHNSSNIYTNLGFALYNGADLANENVAANAKRSKKSGGVASAAAQSRSGSNAARLISGINIYPVGNIYYPVLRFNEPLIIEPSWSLLVMNETVNQLVTGVFDWYEESI